MITDLLSGTKVWNDEEIAINDLLLANRSDARTLIKHFTWSRLEDELGKKFRSAFPKKQYG